MNWTAFRLPIPGFGSITGGGARFVPNWHPAMRGFGAGVAAPKMTSSPDTSTWTVLLPDGTAMPYDLASQDILASNPQVVTPNGTFAYSDIMSAQQPSGIWGGSLFNTGADWTVTNSDGSQVPYNQASQQLLASNPVVNMPGSAPVRYNDLPFTAKLPDWILPTAAVIGVLGVLAAFNGVGPFNGLRRSRRRSRR